MPVNAYSRPGTAAAAFSPTGSGCGHRPTVGPHAGHPQALLLPLLPFATRRCTPPPHTRATCGGWAASAAGGLRRRRSASRELCFCSHPALLRAPTRITLSGGFFLSTQPPSPSAPTPHPSPLLAARRGRPVRWRSGRGCCPTGPVPWPAPATHRLRCGGLWKPRTGLWGWRRHRRWWRLHQRVRRGGGTPSYRGGRACPPERPTIAGWCPTCLCCWRQLYWRRWPRRPVCRR